VVKNINNVVANKLANMYKHTIFVCFFIYNFFENLFFLLTIYLKFDKMIIRIHYMCLINYVHLKLSDNKGKNNPERMIKWLI